MKGEIRLKLNQFVTFVIVRWWRVVVPDHYLVARLTSHDLALSLLAPRAQRLDPLLAQGERLLEEHPIPRFEPCSGTLHSIFKQAGFKK